LALYVLPFLVLTIAEIGAHTGNGKILPVAIQRGNAVVCPLYEPPVCVKGGLHGKLVMLKCEVFFSVPVVGIFRADMFEYRQRLHLLSAKLQTSMRQGRRRLPALPFPAPGRGFRIHSGFGQSGFYQINNQLQRYQNIGKMIGLMLYIKDLSHKPNDNELIHIINVFLVGDNVH